ncbi:MAG: ABC transporter ATP-binding protein [Firmicutes bacterium]|nr:ABC transporter ATP-binding protein [Bacillota bacterium]
MMSENILECRSLSKNYGNVQALKNVSLSMTRGKIVGLLGPNGSGKTTLIKLANGLLTPTSGEILIDGANPGVDTKKAVSYLTDCVCLPDWMTIDELISFFKSFYDNFNELKAYEMINNLNLDSGKKLKTLSKGNKEKVQLILAMSRDADLYLLDEPMGGVDPATRDYILNTIISNYNQNSTVVISTHLISDIEKILDEFIFINNGEIVMQDIVDNVRNEKGMSIDSLFREVFKC